MSKLHLNNWLLHLSATHAGFTVCLLSAVPLIDMLLGQLSAKVSSTFTLFRPAESRTWSNPWKDLSLYLPAHTKTWLALTTMMCTNRSHFKSIAPGDVWSGNDWLWPCPKPRMTVRPFAAICCIVYSVMSIPLGRYDDTPAALSIKSHLHRKIIHIPKCEAIQIRHKAGEHTC